MIRKTLKIDTQKYSFTNIFIFFMSVLFLFWLTGLFINRDSQMILFFGKCTDFLADFTNVILYSADLDPYGNTLNGPAEHAGLPLGYLLYYLISLIMPESSFELGKYMWMDPQVMVFILLIICWWVAVFFIQIYDMTQGSKIVRFAIVMALMFSGIYMFTVERGNFIILSAVACTFFLMNYDNSNKVIKELAFLILAVTAALKYTPALLGIVLLLEGKRKEAVRLIIYGLMFSLVPFVFVEGGFSHIPTILENLSANAIAYRGASDGCNLCSFFVRIMVAIGVSIPEFITSSLYVSSIHLLINVGKVISFVLITITIAAYPFRSKTWQKYLSLIMLVTMMPEHSGAYNILYIFPAIVMFLNDNEHEKWDFLYLIFFIIILNPVQSVAFTWLYYGSGMAAVMIMLAAQSISLLKKNKSEIIPVYKSIMKRLFSITAKHSEHEKSSCT